MPLAVLALAVLPGLLPPRSAIRAIAFSPDGTQFASASDSGNIQLFSLTPGQPKVRQTDLSFQSVPLACLSFSPSGDRLATGGGDGRIYVYRTKPKLVRLWSGQTPHGDANGVAFSPDGKTVAWTAAPTEHAYLYDASSGQLRKSLFLLGNGMESIRFLPDGKTLVTGGQTLTIWDLTQPGEMISNYEPTGAKRVFPDVVGWTTCLDVDATGKTIVACAAVAVEDKGETRSVVLIDSGKGRVTRTLARGGANTHAVAISRNGRYVVAGDATGQVRVWRVGARKLRHRLSASKGEIRAVAISPDARTVAASGDDGIVRMWDMATGKKVAEF